MSLSAAVDVIVPSLSLYDRHFSVPAQAAPTAACSQPACLTVPLVVGYTPTLRLASVLDGRRNGEREEGGRGRKVEERERGERERGKWIDGRSEEE